MMQHNYSHMNGFYRDPVADVIRTLDDMREAKTFTASDAGFVAAVSYPHLTADELTRVFQHIEHSYDVNL